MKVDGRSYRTIWPSADGAGVEVIDQTLLPHRFATRRIDDLDAAVHAIASMVVRGAPLIGAAAAYGLALALRHDPSDAGLECAYGLLLRSRPTAVNLRYALDDVRSVVGGLAPKARADAAWRRAGEICDEDVELCQRIGQAGLPLIEDAHRRLGRPVNILTHCNAGWLATVDWGTATAPIYMAHDRGVPVHVFVDETRPRNQGAALTAFELGQHGVPHTIVADNAGGHLMQHGRVDLCIVGTDRVTARGDVANKIGTYLKALAARANHVPFYVALPHTTIDWTISDGLREIEIEERDAGEVTHMTGRLDNGEVARVMISAPGSPAANPAFDVTPAELVTGLITDRGVCAATSEGLAALFPERRAG
ncbi:S-methyl-5-thioribose-1-phosphate isomerase [Methylocapsa sp. S129]|uniref:S-methyl-5-thioribose-1-phosphate isomerase n=1 Tax=Methylocapsa sp. S129 TaxID=1641869 RepID=UPI00131E303C|nr:S-methyl-5-thioribose-1-phosphate isomerase [Methylocapsa sp. S129]